MMLLLLLLVVVVVVVFIAVVALVVVVVKAEAQNAIATADQAVQEKSRTRALPGSLSSPGGGARGTLPCAWL